MHHIAVGDASLKCPEFYDIITFKRGDFVKENKLAELSMEFAVDIINLVRQLKENREAIISNQIGRSGTSIGANIHEAQYAQGKKDFISKLEIALKEASETGYWLELLHRTNYIDEQLYKSLSAKCTSLRVMLIASCRTAKENAK
ncbi:MAG: four helix bundle protein [Clostridia bacterium]|nr:four helix bundle protein [Clostridia bacterium]